MGQKITVEHFDDVTGETADLDQLEPIYTLVRGKMVRIDGLAGTIDEFLETWFNKGTEVDPTTMQPLEQPIPGPPRVAVEAVREQPPADKPAKTNGHRPPRHSPPAAKTERKHEPDRQQMAGRVVPLKDTWLDDNGILVTVIDGDTYAVCKDGSGRILKSSPKTLATQSKTDQRRREAKRNPANWPDLADLPAGTITEPTGGRGKTFPRTSWSELENAQARAWLREHGFPNLRLAGALPNRAPFDAWEDHKFQARSARAQD